MVVVLSVLNLFVTPAKVEVNVAENTAPNNLTVLNNNKSDFDATKVLESRFLNMLNHNFVYDDAFYSLEDIVNNSVFALLNYRDSEDDSYIAQSYVKDYVFNMYGIEIEDFSTINADYPQKEGYVYILPRGYSVYKHSISSVTKNEDGSYTVKTVVSEDSHDGSIYFDECETLFVANTNSQFGFSIISSVIGGTTYSA